MLHDVFGLTFDEVGEVVGRSSQACRQLASRARRRIASDPATARFPVDRDDHRVVVERFARAVERGDLEGLVAVLAPDVVGDFDSGGTIPGAPVTELDGAVPVARQLIRTLSGAGLVLEPAEVNGDPGLVAVRDGRLVAVIATGVHQGRVDRIHGVGNPAKLAHLID